MIVTNVLEPGLSKPLGFSFGTHILQTSLMCDSPFSSSKSGTPKDVIPITANLKKNFKGNLQEKNV